MQLKTEIMPESKGPNVTPEAKEKLSLKVLAADDSALNREIFSAFLENQGHKVKMVEDGQLLINELLEGSESYDLVLSDNNMPNKKGVEVLEEIRSMEKFKKLPFIIATTDDSSLAKSVTALGGFFLPKPFTPEELASAIEKVTNNSK